MKRRDFLASSLAASASGSLMGGGMGLTAQESTKPGREFYELRLYHLRRGPKLKLLDNFYRDAAIPALNRAGIKSVGAFNVLIGPANPTLYVLIPYASIDALVTARERVYADPELVKHGTEVLNAPATDPAFIRVESSLMMAFEGMPKLEVPAAAAEKGRIFELRTYESHSRRAHLKKVDMFNNGEIAIFRRTGLRPVFFGSTLIGARLPNLTYMLTFAGMEEREKNWAVFQADPEWKKMSTAPEYTDIVSSISNVLLSPTPYSQI